MTIGESSTCHAVPNVIRAEDRNFKTMWLCFLVVAAISCSYFVINAIVKFKKYDVVTNIEYISEIPSPFPAVTFCNDRIDWWPDLTQGISEYLNENKINSFLERKIIYELVFLQNKYSLSSLIKNISILNPVEYENGIKYIYNQTVVFCTFDNQLCDRNDFDIFYDIQRGLCFQFNKKKYPKEIVKKTNKVGIKNGLRLEIFLGYSAETPLFNTYGASLIIHDNNENPSINKGFQLSAGLESNIAVSRTKDIKLGQPYNDCYDLETIDDYDSNSYNQTINLYGKYTQT